MRRHHRPEAMNVSKASIGTLMVAHWRAVYNYHTDDREPSNALLRYNYSHISRGRNLKHKNLLSSLKSTRKICPLIVDIRILRLCSYYSIEAI